MNKDFKINEDFKIKSELIFESAHKSVTILYECDADKNSECTKENCYCNGGNCHMTDDIYCAKRFGIFE